MLREVVKGGLLVSTGIIIAKIFGALFALMLARSLGPEGLGQFNLSILLTSWFTVFALFSVQTVVTQKIAETYADEAKRNRIISAALFLGIISGVVASLIYFFSAELISGLFKGGASVKHLQISSLIIFGGVLYNLVLGVQRGLKKFASYSALEIIKSVLTLIIAIVLLYMGYKVGAGIFALVFAPIIISLMVLASFSKFLTKDFMLEIKPLISFGFMITILSVMLTAITNFDRFFLGILQGKTDVGLYSVGIMIAAFLGLFLPSAIKNTALPFATQSYSEKNFNMTRRLLEKTLIYYLAILSYITIISMMFRKEIIVLLFGDAFLSSSTALGILLFSAVFLSIYTISHSFVLSVNVVKEATITTLAVLITGIPIYIMLIKLSGISGAAMATVICSFLLSASYLMLLRKAIKINLRKLSFLIIMLSLIFGFVFFIPYGMNFAAKIICTAVFLTLNTIFLYAFRFVEKSEIKFVIQKIKKLIKLKS